ncbi:hypothetical protein FOA43_004502 [Brettanomyces nanus]|uniref:Zinc finger Mcm10/DnaG-type domain-containing protein n=1 Tax=Eeniella nana TaxID=13502 RepID=A0A875SC93_EENNA|nr:uncharacterized protein FOA43_004502 [Brettanomyces nanus]QPG77099.1 hypothetical protein FOA43_004502 [Brettanomyces nanus]
MTDDLSDFEDEVLQQLEVIRKLKKQRQEQKTNLVNSDDEEDPRQIDDNHQQTSYFAEKSRKASRNERILKERILKQEKSKSSSDKDVSISSFASRLESHKHRLKVETQKQQSYEEDFLAKRVYSFDLGLNFKPIGEKVNEKDYYTGKYLSKRYVTKKLLESCLNDMKVMRVENVFADIVPPHYRPPDCPNFVVFGVVASKSEALTTSKGRKSKYMKVHISNFREQVTLSLFDKAFKKYWKLRLGDIVGILNPQIWPFKSKDDSGFTLFLKDDTDSILELGHARDFGYCKSIKRDGSRCKVPVDISKGDYCEYHMEMQFKRTAAQRVELGSSVQMFAPRNENGEKEVLLMGGGNKRTASSGSLIVDSLAPRSEEDYGFSSPEASRAFFDQAYTNPKYIPSIATDKVKKTRIQKEKELRKRLATFSGGENLMHRQLEDHKEKTFRNDVTRIAFSPGTMNKIGFDPTRRIYERGIDFDKKVSTKRTHKLLLTLKEEQAKSHKKLKPSKAFLRNKKKQWHANMKEFSHPLRKTHLVELSDSDGDDEEECEHKHEQAYQINTRKRFLALKRHPRTNELTNTVNH